MVSPELLRRYPFFAFMTHSQQQEVAMISDEVEVPANMILFNIDEKADALYLLMTGSVDLHFVVLDENLPTMRKDFLIGTINPGDVFSISAMIEPYMLTSTAIVTEPCSLLKIDAVALRKLCDQDHDLAFGLQKQLARTTMERLHATRVLLAAATTPV
jgi:CRP/FNR family transcriptional regulator, cyclic AMP receptor protein